MLAVLLACTGIPEPTPKPPAPPVVRHDVEGLRSLAPLPEKVEEVSWLYAPIGTPGGLGPTDYRLRAWVTVQDTSAQELQALYGVPGKPGLWGIDPKGVMPPDDAVTLDEAGGVRIRGSVYPQDGPMLTRVIVCEQGIWIEGMTR